MSQSSFFERINQTLRNSITFRLATVGILILILLIPTAMIKDLINERARSQKQAITEVSNTWGYPQTIVGPIISVPYQTYKSPTSTAPVRWAHFLPDEFNVEGNIQPHVKNRGIYKISLYSCELDFKGSFTLPNFDELKVDKELVMWDDAIISLGMDDLRGINETVKMKWNNDELVFGPGIVVHDISNGGVSTNVPLDTTEGANQKYNFSMRLSLSGSKSLSFVPIGKETKVHLKSPWKDPSYFGAFLPLPQDDSVKGIDATWKIIQLNRNFPQQWKGKDYNPEATAFGVQLLIPVDQYQKTMRSAKYAVMFISLTFLIFFFVEILNKRYIHPIQYILVGLALCIFYSLLLSISEHINFNVAYLVSSITIILLITGYSYSIFKNKRLALVMGGVLMTLYGFLFSILQLSEYALLMGSIGLLIVLAAVMYLSRNINWNNVSKNGESKESE